ncbi:MAG: hypothetical protein ACI8SK_000338 [Shewanella sp.]|jgi:hypothetical protein
MQQCNSSLKRTKTYGFITIILSLLFIPYSIAADCQRDVKYHNNQQNKKFLVDVSLKLPPSFQTQGTLEISGFRCVSPIENNQDITMSMSKSASLPQYDIFYTAPDGVKFSNILQASVFPWDESLTINMDSTVLSDLLKNIPKFRHFHTKDKQTLITQSRASKYLSEWSTLRSKRISKDPLIYAYPLPNKENKLLLLAINEFNGNYQNLHRKQVNNITQQPDEVISSMLSKLLSGNNNIDDFSKYFEGKYTHNDRDIKRLFSLNIGSVKQVELIKNEPLKGTAMVRVKFGMKDNQDTYAQKFLMKRVQSKWLLASAYSIDRL